MMPKILKQRSSWPSSLLTGLIGWNGFAVVAALAFGRAGSPGELFLMASLAAVLQVLILRLGFFALRMDRAIWVGAAWGGLTAGVLVAGEIAIFETLRQHPVVALVTGLYIGPPVGAFLSYFHRDDRKIEAAAKAAGTAVDYGRDGHWLDPFLYGAVSYLVVFTPQTIDLAVSATIVGAVTGVFAAGVSHFFLSRWRNALWTVPAAGLAGAAFGAATGLLFRNLQPQMLLPHLLTGAIAGSCTYVVTAAVGRSLALKEGEAG